MPTWDSLSGTASFETYAAGKEESGCAREQELELHIQIPQTGYMSLI